MLKIGVLGATGMVGQKYISLLENHPWFEVTFLAASPQSAGKSYADAVSGRWHMEKAIPKSVNNLTVYDVANLEQAANCDFVFSALSSGAAKEWEHKYAAAGIPVVSNASTHRGDSDVPMLIPEINHQHLDLINSQKQKRGWNKGFIVVKPNCSLQSYMTPLYALREFGIKKVVVSTLQALSGAGYPGPSAFTMIDNVVPFIGGEEKKTELEPLKILGTIQNGEIVNSTELTITAHCNRVPVLDGHLACVSVEFENPPTKEQILERWKSFKGVPQELDLPLAPQQPIIYREEDDRPQPKADRDNDKGMAVTVGRLRECPLFHWKFVGLSHNTVRGAAGGGILNAELLKARGYFNGEN